MDWIEIGRSFGIPVAVMAVMMFGVWSLARWIGTELIIPLRNTIVSKAIVLFDKVEKTLDTLDKNISEVVSGMETYNKVLSNLEAASKLTAERIVAEHGICHSHHCAIADSLKEIAGGLRDIKGKTDTLASSCPILVSPPKCAEENTANTGIPQSRATPAHGIPTSTRILTHPVPQTPPNPPPKRGHK
jgi:hypothetical protein